MVLLSRLLCSFGLLLLVVVQLSFRSVRLSSSHGAQPTEAALGLADEVPSLGENQTLVRRSERGEGCEPGARLFSQLRLNRPAADGPWRCVRRRQVQAVMLTFGSRSMSDFLLNWVAHVRKLDAGPYLVGALDEPVARLCEEQSVSAATVPESALRALGLADHSAQLSRSSAAYYRYQPGTFLRMGLVKELFIRQVLLAGFDAMVSDVDVAWLRPPWPLVRYSGAGPPVEPEAALIALADVILSVDQVQQYMDSDKHRWHVDSELNTGIVFFRATAPALAVLDEWRLAMADAIATNNPNHDQFWLNQVLNPRKFANLKEDTAARVEFVVAALGAQRNHSDVQLPPQPVEAAGFDAREPSLRAAFRFERLFGATPAGESGIDFKRRPKGGWPGGLRPVLATFPIARVSNGHTFFIQRLHEIVGVPPVCVHTTYQYGDASSYAYGKRERLRDAHLWLVDPPEYYAAGRFLQLTSAPARLLSPSKAELERAELRAEKHCVMTHLKLNALQRQWLQLGFLLAAALRRTLILPPLWCVVDRFWTILDHCLIGAKVEMPQPFVCPLDHSFDLPAMRTAMLEWREHTFLDNPRTPAEVRTSVTRVRVGDDGIGDGASGRAGNEDGNAGGDGGGAQAWVPAGATLGEAARTLRGEAARVLQLDVTDLERLCACIADLPEVHKLSRALPAALSMPYHFCDTTDNPYFVQCKAEGHQGCRKHPVYLMNVSRGTQRPPPVPYRRCGREVGAGEPRCAALELPIGYISEGVQRVASV